METPDWDNAIARASWAAAESVTPQAGDTSFLEKRLAAALGEALETERPDVRVSLNKKLGGFDLPHWDPFPGWLDVAVLDHSDQVLVVAELKLDDIDQTLWDIFKIGAALHVPSVEAGYVIAAAPTSTWESKLEVVELFDAQDQEEWASRYFFEAYEKAWRHLLRGGTGRPTSVAQTFWITPITRCTVDHYPPYELRAIRIQVSQEQIALRDAWPEKLRGEIADRELRPTDVPSAASDEQTLHEFALTTNGYERMGTFQRCASLGNSAIERWRQTGELPHSLRDLRCCLFFEQRRWRHSGYPFDEETMRYARALCEAIRSKVPITPP